MLFIFSASVFIWSAGRLRAFRDSAASPPPSLSSRQFPPVEPPLPTIEKKRLWTFPPPEQPPDLLPAPAPSGESPAVKPKERTSGSLQPPISPLLPSKGDPALIMSMVEDKFAEIAKRMTALEHPKKDMAPPAYLEPLLKRVQEIESELKNMKFGFTQLASAQNAININEVTSKIQSIQKMLETLTGGTDVSKPS